jgi:hypothetical protein
MPTVTSTPIVPDLAAWTLKRLTCNPPMDLAGVDTATLPDPWGAVAVAVQGAAPKDRTRVLTQELRDRGLDPQAVTMVLAGVNQNDPPPQPPKPRYVIHSASEAMQGNWDPEWLIEKLLAIPAVGLVHGLPGSKKTWTVLHLGVSVAAGLPTWLGFPIKGGPVLLIDEESGVRRTNHRLAQVMRGLGVPADIPLYYVSLATFNMRDPADIAEVEGLVAALKPVLVIADALRDLSGGANENYSWEMQPIMLAFKRISEAHGCSFVILHHSNKQGGYAGSTGIPGGADVLLHIESKVDSGTIDFETEKPRDGEPLKFSAVATWLPDEGAFRMAPAPKVAKQPHYSRAEQYVIDYLTKNGPSLLTDIEDHADVCSPGSAKNAVYSLAGKGVIRRCDAGGPGSKATYELTPEQEYDPWQEATGDS